MSTRNQQRNLFEELGILSEGRPADFGSGNLFRDLGIQLQPPPEPPEPPSITGEFGGGLRAGVKQIKGDVQALGAVASQTVGADEFASSLAQLAQETEAGIEPPAVPFEQAFESPRNFALFTARALGEQVPVVASVIASGGIGSLVGRLLARGAVNQAAANILINRFGVGGAITGATAIETGATAQEQLGSIGALRPGVAISAGLAKGVLEAAVPVAFARRFGLLGGQGEDFISRIMGELDNVGSRPLRMLATGATASPVEAATELTQEAVDVAARQFVDENFDALTPETRNRILEAATTGGIVGFFFGGLGGAITRPSEVDKSDFPLRKTKTEELPGFLPSEEAQRSEDIKGEVFVIAGRRRNLEPLATTEGGTQIFEAVEAEEVPVALSEKGGARATSIFRVDQENTDVSGDIFSLPVSAKEITRENDRIVLTNESTAEEALDLAREALREREKSALEFRGDTVARRRSSEQLTRPGAKTMQKANALFAQAIEKGFRIRPRSGDNMVVVGVPQPGQLAPTQPPIVTPEAGRLEATTATSGGEHLRPPAFSITSEDLPAVKGQSLASTGGTLPIGTVFSRSKIDAQKASKGNEQRFTLSPATLRQNVLGSTQASAYLKLRSKAAGENPIESLRAAGAIVDDNADIDKIFELLDITVRGVELPAEHVVQLAEAGLVLPPREGASQAVLVGQAPFSALRRTVDRPLFRRTPMAPPEGRDEIILALDGFMLNLDGSVFRDGSRFLAEGTVGEVVPLSTKQLNDTAKKNLKKISSILKEFLERFGLADKKSLFVTAGGRPGSLLSDGSSTLGFYTATGTHADTISIPIGPLNEKELGIDFISTIAHEFGHMLFIQRFGELDAGTQAKLLSAYNRSLIRASNGTFNDFIASFLAVDRASHPSFMRERDRDTRGFLDFGATDAEYFLNFDEWAADQVARWALTEREPLTVIERFMKKIGREVKKALIGIKKALGIRDAQQLLPEPEMSEFLNTVFNQTRQKGAESNLQTVFDVSAQQSAVDNASQLNADGIEGDIPDQPQTVGIKRLFKKLGVQNKRVETQLDYFSWLVKWGWNLLQLAEKNKHIQGLQEYVGVVERWYNRKMQWISLADERVKQWRALSTNMQKNLSRMIFAVDAMEYLTKKEVENGVARKPTEQELVSLARKYKIDDDAFNLYRKIEEDFVSVLDTIEAISESTIRQQIKNQLIADVQVARMKADMAALKQRPYFPHMRFGKFAVIVKDVDGGTRYMEQVESRADAQKRGEEIRKQISNRGESDKLKVRVDKIPETVEPFKGMPTALLRRVRDTLKLTAEQERWLDDLIVQMSPEQSFRRRFARRENIPGFSLDAQRAYASYFFHGANYLSRIEFEPLMQDIIDGLGQETSQLGLTEPDVIKRREIVDFLRDHKNHIMNPGPDWAQLRSAAFIWWLGFSPASAALNLTQIPLVGWPYLSARFGDGKSANALRKAVRAVQRMYKNKPDAVTQQDLRLLDLAVRQGFIDESQATELAGTAQGDTIQRLLPGSKAQRFLMQTAHWAGWMFQQSEKLNRRIVFRAAADLARNNPDVEYLNDLVRQNIDQFHDLVEQEGLSTSEAKAFLAGKDAVRRTQFEYASWARPRFMRGRKGTLLMFFMFVQNSVWFAAHSPGRTRYLLMMMLAAGLMGLPGAEDLASIARFISRNLFGSDFDVERELRELVVAMTDGELPPDLILHGTSRVGFGLHHAFDAVGVPFPKFDFSANISMGQIVPGVAELGRPGLEFEERFANVSTDVAGAAFGVGINLLKVLSDDALPITDAKRYERALPRALRNAVRGVRFAKEGRERARDGATVVEFDASDPNDLAETVGQALGFTPTKLSRKWDQQTMQREVIGFWTIQRGMLFRQYDHAKVVGDKEAERDAIAAIRRFNNEVPFPTKRISISDLKRSARERVRRRKLREKGIPTTRRDIPIAQEVQGLFPEVTHVEDVTGKGN